jgi:hypothetical protein
MHIPQRREEVRYIHIDSKKFSSTTKNKYTINFNVSSSGNVHPEDGTFIPVQDYNNITKIELKVFKLSNTNQSDNDDQSDYVIFKLKNIDGHFDSNTNTQNASSIIYFDGNKPVFDNDSEFNFNPTIAKLSKLDIELIGSDGNVFNKDHSFILKLTYIEGNLY